MMDREIGSMGARTAFAQSVRDRLRAEGKTVVLVQRGHACTLIPFPDRRR